MFCPTPSILETRWMILWLQWIAFSNLEGDLVGKNIGRFSSPFVKFVKSKPVLAATDQEKKKKVSVPKAKVSNHDFRRLEPVC